MIGFLIHSQSREAARLEEPVPKSSPLSLMSLVKSLVAELRSRRAIKELRRSSDHMLKDIGLTREEIECMVRYGKGSGRL